MKLLEHPLEHRPHERDVYRIQLERMWLSLGMSLTLETVPALLLPSLSCVDR